MAAGDRYRGIERRLHARREWPPASARLLVVGDKPAHLHQAADSIEGVLAQRRQTRLLQDIAVDL
jgi:hypothetical protein